MSIVIVSESFIVKDSLTNVFIDIFKTDNVIGVSNIDLSDISYISNIDFMLIDTSISNDELLNYVSSIRKENLKSKMVVLDYKRDKDLFSKVIKLGVEGYILNVLEKDEFIYIVRKIINGKKFYDPELLQYNIEDTIYSKNRLLTNRERCVLGYVSKGLSNRDIAKNLGVTDYTIKKHVSSILTKLKLKNRQDIIIYARDNNTLDNIG